MTVNPAAILADFERHGITARVVGGRLRTRGGVPPHLAPTIREHKTLVIAVLIGRATGHAWAPCTTCAEGTLTAALTPQGKPRQTWPACRMTPRCPGRHEPDPAELKQVAAIPPPAQATAPARPPRQRLLGDRLHWPEETESAR